MSILQMLHCRQVSQGCLIERNKASSPGLCALLNPIDLTKFHSRVEWCGPAGHLLAIDLHLYAKPLLSRKCLPCSAGAEGVPWHR